MVATSTTTSLCNRSLFAGGSKSQIGNLTERSAQADACNLFFIPTYNSLARTAWWNCFQKQATLSLLLAAANTPENPSGTPPFPATPWVYQYLQPSDCLKARAVLPTVPAQSTGGVPLTTAQIAAPISLQGLRQIPFRVAYATDASNNPLNVILTNQEQAVLNYTVNQPNPAIWDSQFEEAFVAALAAFLVPALSLHMPLFQANVTIAERMIAAARTSDGNEGSSSQDNLPDWMRARAGGSGGWYEGGYYNVGYDNMAWPAYGG